MVRMHYNRKLNEKPRIFKFFTLWEFTLLLFVLVTPTIITNILDLPPTFIDSIILLVLFFLFILRFKLGRPEGYFPHWIKQFFTPRHMRPGHHSPEPPILLEPEPIPTRKDLVVTERYLFDNYGMVYVGRGKAIQADALPQEVIDSYLMALDSGNPISLPEPNIPAN